MATHTKGFSLIEVILFLGVTGLVMAVMLVGVGNGLNQQKYRDASNEFVSYLQNQYNLVTNVNNSRPDTTVCSGGSISTGSVPGPAAGASNCTIVGRILHSRADGSGIDATQVVSTVDPTSLPVRPDDSDTQILRDAHLIAAPDVDAYSPSWDTTIVAPGGGDHTAAFSILIVRMPTTGVIHTYSATTANLSPSGVVGLSGTLQDIKLCLNPNGLIGLSTQPVGALISKNAANSSGVSFVAQGGC